MSLRSDEILSGFYPLKAWIQIFISKTNQFSQRIKHQVILMNFRPVLSSAIISLSEGIEILLR
jgi:hypothetical protein